ncbi:TonB-dependent receptor plug domain-containing protein [Sphingomonas sp. AOB5]|uniref:TonB-dependent receptor plug domain-containing protein n=1 Tax=Sphingomonas sp. AOB5 TaxID=3034017 RepID=UPI0023F6944D|nr:TonB-dependent receptor [Sphingomonas sp. AOB5]MDF7774962.1 TonB-dependent receptor plug domain-containing protein [Sphingomonas sp. AOB5]
MTKTFKLILAAGISTLALGTASTAMAQTSTPATQEEAAEEGPIQTSNEIVVQGAIGFRNRSETTVPTLVYDTDYFQRFEPLTAGDALKRVPSVTFLSDVIESDGARLRGMDPGYTQILINGDKVPGSNADRSFFLDRIPAELISRVEIVRSNSARRTGDAMAGTLNIVLRDGYQLDGGYIRVGGLRFDDGKVKPSIGVVYGGEFAGGRLLIGGNIQGRYNPKLKSSLRYSDSPENNPNYATASFVNREDQTDTRDGTDYAFNATYGIEFGGTKVELSGFYVQTIRTETERSFEYNRATGNFGPVPGASSATAGLLTDNANVNRINQENYSINGKIKQNWGAGETTLKIGYAAFSDNQKETENEIDFDRATPRFTGDLTLTRVADTEFSVSLDHEIDLGEGLDVVFGGFVQDKTHDIDLRTARQRFNLTNPLRTTWNQFTQNPTSFLTTPTFLLPPTGGLDIVKENRRDGFALVEGKNGVISWEAGLRYEHTSVTSTGTADRDYGILLPSASAKIELTPSDRITVSGARTVRRPRLDYLTPITLLAELGDNDLQGNPALRPESAWGADVGYEHRIGSTGVVGINFFYRNVTDLIELANTGVTGSEGAGTFVYQPRNTGDGQVYGVEFDLSTDLRFIGLRNTGVFGNFSYLESDIDDALGSRRFNGQSKYVFNVGFIQNLPSVGGAFGVTYRKQGGAYDRTIGEEVTTNYGADLEVFVEKRFGNSFTIRAVGSNLLDGSKDEVFNKFTTFGDQQSRSFDEYEIETERAGPVFQVMARLAF